MIEVFFGWIVKKIGEIAFGKMIGDTLEEKFPKLFKSKKKEYKNKLKKSYQRRIDEAKTKLEAGKNETAKKEYETILRDLNSETEKIDPHLFFRVYKNLGVCKLNLGNPDKAAELYPRKERWGSIFSVSEFKSLN